MPRTHDIPPILAPLFADVANLKGVGPQARVSLRRLWGMEAEPSVPIRELLFHLPLHYADRSLQPGLMAAKDGEIATLEVEVTKHQPSPPGNRRVPYRVTAWTIDGALTLVFFNARAPWLRQHLPEGERRVVSGRIQRSQYGVQMIQPDWMLPLAEAEKLPGLEPVYPLSEGLAQKQMQRWAREALARLPALPEWIDPALKARERWPDFADALASIHQPLGPAEASAGSVARQRLAYDELLAYQVSLALIRQGLRREAVPPLHAGALPERLVASLPFTLTGGQREVWDDIRRDLASGERMLRLLQGDVGSGKTVVALLAMLAVVEAQGAEGAGTLGGGQAVLMAPTELLAQQHARTLNAMLAPLGLEAPLLTGSVKGAERRRILDGLENGEIAMAVGTHAVFQESVNFWNLRLAVIDEQHRFGVQQRLTLAQKGPGTHILLMSATPIPRSLALTAFGDMDVSSLREKPPGRQAIATAAIARSREAEVLAAIDRALGDGQKVYWICPLVEDSESGLELAAAESRAREFRERYGARVGLVHGRMPGAARDEVMRGFAGDAYDLLVATTVVEVGVDVPEATIMIIEQAERFGLAQLHQLRGRVGRGTKPSSCLLLYDDKAGDTSRERLRAIRNSQDGFEIAEADLRLRGSGELLGTRQSGVPRFHFADLAQHVTLVMIARDDARYALERDPELTGERGSALRLLMPLFEQGEKLRYLGSG